MSDVFKDMQVKVGCDYRVIKPALHSPLLFIHPHSLKR